MAQPNANPNPPVGGPPVPAPAGGGGKKRDGGKKVPATVAVTPITPPNNRTLSVVLLSSAFTMLVGFIFGVVIMASSARDKIDANKASIADREAEVAAKETRMAAIEEEMKKEVEFLGVRQDEDGTKMIIKRTQEVNFGARPTFGVCEEGEIPLAVPEPQAAPAELVKEAPQAQAPPKPKPAADWPKETIDGTVEKVPPPARKPAAAVQKRWKFLGRDQFGCEYWEEVPAARDIRYRFRNSNEFQMR